MSQEADRRAADRAFNEWQARQRQLESPALSYEQQRERWHGLPPPDERLGCGHPAQCATGSDEGAHCGWCAEVEELRRQIKNLQGTVKWLLDQVSEEERRRFPWEAAP